MLINTPVDNRVIVNPRQNYPSMTINDLLTTVRIDQSKGEDLLEAKILQAIDTINRQLESKHFIAPPLDDNQTRYYKHAVCHEAAAVIAEDNLDFDTSTTGQIRGENGLAKVSSLRRVVNYAIADLTGRKRNRVKLL